jgi:hypothetical protein
VCTIIVLRGVVADRPLVVAANRDEVLEAAARAEASGKPGLRAAETTLASFDPARFLGFQLVFGDAARLRHAFSGDHQRRGPGRRAERLPGDRCPAR